MTLIQLCNINVIASASDTPKFPIRASFISFYLLNLKAATKTFWKLYGSYKHLNRISRANFQINYIKIHCFTNHIPHDTQQFGWENFKALSSIRATKHIATRDARLQLKGLRVGDRVLVHITGLDQDNTKHKPPPPAGNKRGKGKKA